MAEVTLLIHDLAAAVTPEGSGPLRGAEFGAVRIHSPASIAIAGERIAAVGPPAEILRGLPSCEDYESVDGRGRVALPGLVDCHTHPVFLGDRAAEFELRSSGATYEEIHASGGGIRSTVAATRAGSENDLRSSVERHLGWMLEYGTTTAEAKSGYGLDSETELKSLRAIHDAAHSSPVDVYPTFLGAHTIPPEFDSAAEYVEFVIHEVLPEAAPLARFADVFLERGSFEAPDARRYLEACREYGLPLRFHADQFSERGAIPLALELGACSVDHLEATKDKGALLLAKSSVADVFLPACGLFLDLP